MSERKGFRKVDLRCSLLGTAKRRRPSKLGRESAWSPLTSREHDLRKKEACGCNTDWLTRSISAKITKMLKASGAQDIYSLVLGFQSGPAE